MLVGGDPQTFPSHWAGRQTAWTGKPGYEDGRAHISRIHDAPTDLISTGVCLMFGLTGARGKGPRGEPRITKGRKKCRGDRVHRVGWARAVLVEGLARRTVRPAFVEIARDWAADGPGLADAGRSGCAAIPFHTPEATAGRAVSRAEHGGHHDCSAKASVTCSHGHRSPQAHRSVFSRGLWLAMTPRAVRRRRANDASLLLASRRSGAPWPGAASAVAPVLVADDVVPVLAMPGTLAHAGSGEQCHREYPRWVKRSMVGYGGCDVESCRGREVRDAPTQPTSGLSSRGGA